MSTVRKTKSGWVHEITTRKYGMLMQGGITGREELYKRETLAKHGIPFDADPDAFDICPVATTIEWLSETVGCDKVLKSGHRIQ